MVATGPTLHCSMGLATKDVAPACAHCIWANSPTAAQIGKDGVG